MKDLLEAVTSFIPVLQSSPAWVKMYFTVWLFASVGLIASVIFAHGPEAGPDPQKPLIEAPIYISGVWPTWTGDAAIDEAHRELNSLSPTPPEGQLVSALRNVFYKPIFQHIYEDQPDRALFTLCRAQLLLQTYVSKFSSPDVRRRILLATQNLISLQEQLGQLYGPTFQGDQHQRCDTHATTLTEYTSTLPPRQQDRLEGAQFDKIMRTLGILRDNLRSVNLMD